VTPNLFRGKNYLELSVKHMCQKTNSPRVLNHLIGKSVWSCSAGVVGITWSADLADKSRG
jgi:hypothetical protein